MFKFDFDIDDAEDFEGITGVKAAEPIKAASEETATLEPFFELSVQQLLESFPQLLSYSPIHIPLSSSRKATALVRRDLFDARFQLISEGAGDAVDGSVEPVESKTEDSDRKALEFLDAPSDLVPGVYEGGLKTWECSLDVVDYLDGLKDGSHGSFVGKKILDVGCGTGVPSMYVLRELLETLDPSEKNAAKTEIHLQDYNASVLQLMTLPNLLLTWYSTIHADPYRYATNDSETAPTIDLSNAGEVIITPELKSAFVESLASLNISIRLFSGSWDTFNSGTRYDIVLTSETIYRTESLDSLITLMQTACTGKATSTLETLVSTMSISEKKTGDVSYLCLVAAKVLYFGVGGGVSDFIDAVNGHKGRVETVLERKTGVGRQVMRVYWS